jgi:uncharacterized membrane protein YoaK (UPF0700 family)
VSSLVGLPSSARRTLARATRSGLGHVRRAVTRLPRPDLENARSGLRKHFKLVVGCAAGALFGIAVGFPSLTGPLSLVLALIAVVVKLREK